MLGFQPIPSGESKHVPLLRLSNTIALLPPLKLKPATGAGRHDIQPPTFGFYRLPKDELMAIGLDTSDRRCKRTYALMQGVWTGPWCLPEQQSRPCMNPLTPESCGSHHLGCSTCWIAATHSPTWQTQTRASCSGTHLSKGHRFGESSRIA